MMIYCIIPCFFAKAEIPLFRDMEWWLKLESLVWGIPTGRARWSKSWQVEKTSLGISYDVGLAACHRVQ